MAIFAGTDVSFVWNSVDLSDHLVEIDLPLGAVELDATAMGATQEIFFPGLVTWDGVSATFQQDYASSKTDQTFGPAVIAKTIATLTLKPTSAAVSATNPRYYGACFIKEYTPVTGKVGDLAMTKVTFAAYGTLARGTS